MFHIALWEPEIPPNTGNIARLCAATGASLHLIGRLGFRLDDRSLKRAGLDYWSDLTQFRHGTIEEFFSGLAASKFGPHSGRGYCLSTHATNAYTQASYEAGDYLLFGSESKGLSQGIIHSHGDRTLRIPMPAGKVRSLNLATAVGIVLYEALRQLHAW